MLHTEDGVTAAQYTVRATDPYVRTIVRGPAATLFLNPVIRWDGVSLPSPHAAVWTAATWLQRGAALIAAVGLLVVWVRRKAG